MTSVEDKSPHPGGADWSYVDKSWVDADPQYGGAEPRAKPAPKHAA